MYVYAARAAVHAVTGIATALSGAYLYSHTSPRLYSVQQQQHDTIDLRIYTAAGDSVGVRSITHEGLACLRDRGYDVEIIDTATITERSVPVLRVRGTPCDPTVFDACHVRTHVRTDTNEIHTLLVRRADSSYIDFTSLTH
jgi:hypothetical protein